MQEGIERYGHRVLAFCLMTNHIHLALQVGEVSLSRIMQNLTFRYTRWVNWRLKRSGHLFQGRYKSVLVDADSYLLELIAYIHLNPVRASMVATAEAHNWSSHRAYLGKEMIPWLNTDYIFSQFSPEVSKARRQFMKFVTERSKDGHQEEFYGQGSIDSRVMGEDRFVEDVLEKTELIPIRKPGIAEVLQVVMNIYELQEYEIAAPGQKRVPSEARSLAAWAVQELTDEPLTKLAVRLGRDPSSLSAAIRRFELRRNNEPECEEKVTRARQELQVTVFQA
jgi:REP element-mobilizing transposase RayT